MMLLVAGIILVVGGTVALVYQIYCIRQKS